MKNVKLFEQFINEGINVPVKEFKAWHTSPTELKKLGDTPMWFTTKEKWAKEYHEICIENHGQAYTYEVKIKGRILNEKQSLQWAEENGIDYEEMVSDLTSNPSADEIMELVASFPTICDGIEHYDYEPVNWGDGKSTLVFHPNKIVHIVKQYM